MPKTNPSKKKKKSSYTIKIIQNSINNYISTTTTTNDQFEKRYHIQNLVNNYKLSRKNRKLLNQWINNLLNDNQSVQQKTKIKNQKQNGQKTKFEKN